MYYKNSHLELHFEKCIPIHGIRINEKIDFPILIDDKRYDKMYVNSIKLFSYSEYLNQAYRFINRDDVNECDLVAMFTTQHHNSMEVENIKIILSSLYFADRMSNTSKLKDIFISNEMKFHLEFFKDKDKDIDRKKLMDRIEKSYFNIRNEYFLNYHIRGYFDNEDKIRPLYWYISLGNNKVTNDNFDKFMTRGFSNELCEEYIKQANFNEHRYVIDIDMNDTFFEEVRIIALRLNRADEYSKKIKSALRLYYNVLYESDIEQSILTYAVILETLLLKRNETKGQKSKVANRCTCIVANGMNKEQKIFIANHVAYFYSYRNAVIHDGKSYLEIDDEVTFNNIMCSIRHIIYFVIKYVLDNNINEINEIKRIVVENLRKDSVDIEKGYITYSKEDDVGIELIFIDE